MKCFLLKLMMISSIVLLGFVPVNACQREIANKVLRFHVIANSDTLKDQHLKLKVRDGVIKYLSEEIKYCDCVESCKKVIEARLEEIQSEARSIIKAHGYNYSVDVFLLEKYFPEKKYGEMTFPRGYYEALTIEIGSGTGRNWWCVLFPNLCFSDAVTARVSDDSKVLLKEQLTKDAYAMLLEGKNVQIRFKILEIVADLFSE